MTQSEIAFEVFIGTCTRARLSAEEKALYDYHKGRKRSWNEIAEQIRDYREKESK